MLSKNQIKLICSLHQKKFRDAHKLFIVEGKKMVFELANSHTQLLQQIVVSEHFSESNLDSLLIPPEIVDEKTFKKLSELMHPQGILAIFKQPNYALNEFDFALALDGIQDPGNMGTILRTCDWFGIKHVICSKDCVDIFNPKAVQASMGSVLRVSVAYKNLLSLLKAYKKPIYGAVLEGKNIYSTQIQKEGILVMGNEGNGISKEVQSLLTHQLKIPQWGGGESLNVSTATAIMISEFARR